MTKGNCTPNIFDNSVQCLLNMRQLAQFGPTSFNNEIIDSCQINDYEYIRPSPSIGIETSLNNNINSKKKIQQNNRFAYLMPDIESVDKYNEKIFRMKYQLPNMQVLQSPTKLYNPIQVVSFTKNEI